MTTHDYQGDTSYPASTEPTTASVGPESERLVEPTTLDEPVAPDTSGDPAWQQRADQFAANRDQRDDVQSSSDTALFEGTDLQGFRGKWDSVQAAFVDDPRSCVEQADGLVSDVVAQLSNSFAEARSRLEQQWSRGEEASTEDLRVALKRYREFFDRLLAV